MGKSAKVIFWQEGKYVPLIAMRQIIPTRSEKALLLESCQITKMRQKAKVG